MTTRIEDKIQAVKEQTNTYVQEIKKLVEELAVQNKISLISYFTSSFNISYDSEQESLCLGSYHIRNIGHTTVTNPYLCIKLPKDSPFYFSGRYVHENFTPTLKTQGQSNWERFNDKSSKEEYWLRPVGSPPSNQMKRFHLPIFKLNGPIIYRILALLWVLHIVIS